WSGHGEAGIAAGRESIFDLDVVDARARRPVAQRALEALDRFGVAFSQRFDAAVREIAHPAVHAFALGGLESKVPEPDGLDAPSDQKSPRDAHGGTAGRLEGGMARLKGRKVGSVLRALFLSSPPVTISPLVIARRSRRLRKDRAELHRFVPQARQGGARTHLRVVDYVQRLLGFVGFLDDRAELCRELLVGTRTAGGSPIAVHPPSRTHELILQASSLGAIGDRADEHDHVDGERMRSSFHPFSPLIHGWREVHELFPAQNTRIFSVGLPKRCRKCRAPIERRSHFPPSTFFPSLPSPSVLPTLPPYVSALQPSRLPALATASPSRRATAPP